MRSSLLPNDLIVNKRGKSILGRVLLVSLAFAIVLIITLGLTNSNNQFHSQIFFNFFIPEAAIFGVLFIVAGWLEFSLLQTIEAIPLSKIEGAAEGLNEIQGNLIPEKGNPLISPISKQECFFYQLELQKYVQMGDGSYWKTVAKFAKGIPTLLTDDTGYLAIDFENANLTREKSLTLYPYNNNKWLSVGDKLGQDLIEYFKTSSDDFDVSNLGIILSPSYSLTFTGSQLAIVETVIASGKERFAMGRVVNTNQTLNGKKVKAMIYDRSTKILSVRDESRQSLETKDKLLSYFSLGFGIALLVIGVFYLF
ncbi:MAG: hypothetical protein M1594_01715 [Candidatus Marsarchaeota archaeon]|nr:hypothetical protein [Candidatus Marsarchaeota archaeon]